MPQREVKFPEDWRISKVFIPDQHLMKIKGRDYMNVQNRLMWFIRDQRELIIAGLDIVTYEIKTEIIELDRDRGWAHFKTFIRDVLGNEVTMYGSESKLGFPDYIEKASTKSLGRALLLLGYGTAFAVEDMDEGERVVDSPVSSHESVPSNTNYPLPAGSASTPSTTEKKFDNSNFTDPREISEGQHGMYRAVFGKLYKDQIKAANINLTKTDVSGVRRGMLNILKTISDAKSDDLPPLPSFEDALPPSLKKSTHEASAPAATGKATEDQKKMIYSLTGKLGRYSFENLGPHNSVESLTFTEAKAKIEKLSKEVDEMGINEEDMPF